MSADGCLRVLVFLIRRVCLHRLYPLLLPQGLTMTDQDTSALFAEVFGTRDASSPGDSERPGSRNQLGCIRAG
jgi:hypothetical protein